VTANNANGTSANSTEVSATPVPLVSDLSAVATTNGSIQLTWSGTPGTTYNVKRSSICGGPYNTIAATVTGTTYTDWMVSAGQTNYYIVTITNAGTESIPSNEEGASVNNLPWPWLNTDVGAVDLTGSASYNSGTFSISGSGRGIPDFTYAANLDYFQFVYVYVPKTTSGGYVQAHITSVQNTSANAKAGVMIRENLYADSQFAMADVQRSTGMEFVRRNGTGANATGTTVTGTAPKWVRLTRTNNTFQAYSSSDGNTWAAIGTPATFTSMASGAYVGLVVSSGDNGFLNTSVLDNVSSTFLPANTAPILAVIPNQAVNVGQVPPVTATATDADVPPPVLTFNLLNAPATATLIKTGSTNAVFNWRPQVSDANTTNLVTLKVADNGTPSLSATQNFQITVNSLTQPSFTAPVWNNGQFSLLVNGQQGPDYAVEATTNLTDWATVWTTNSPPMPFSWLDTNAGAYPTRFYRLVVGPPLP
jgi:hypothetical protein